MPFFVIARMPGSVAGVEISGPFADRQTAEARRPQVRGVAATAHVIEAASAEVAQEMAAKAFSPSPDA